MNRQLQLSVSAACGLFLFFGSQKAAAQSTSLISDPTSGPGSCGTEAPGQQWEQRFQELIKETARANAKSQSQPVVYTIPVIIHVIHGGEPVGTYPNLAQGQLNSQVQVLNEDFGGIGYNSGNYPSTAFSTFASNENIVAASLDGMGRVKIANCNVQFCLATKDTAGNVLPEPGIDRISYVSRGWANPASFGTTTTLKNFVNGTIKPQTVWNVTRYMNIWVTDNNINANNLLGYATFPLLSGLTGIPVGTVGADTTDGFWCYSRVFGSKTIFPSGTYYGGYERGRVSTHEIGHYLGLRHIGGDANSSAGDCNATDYCADTPPQKGGYNTGSNGQNFGSPAYPLFVTGASSCPVAVNGSMFMNFMDYTDDGSKYMYTNDQGIRIQAAMQNAPYRKFLGTHNLCTVSEVASVSQFKSAATVCQFASLTLTNTSFGTPVPTYTWSSTGNVSFLPDANTAAAVVFNSPGTQVITLTTNNGTVSVYSRTITVNAAPVVSLSAQSGDFCMDEVIDIVASGGNSYLWKPGNITGSTMGYDGSADQSYTCIATGPGGCTNSVEINLRAVDCTSIKDNYTDENIFAVYPNPSQGTVYLKSKINGSAEISLEVFDISGKLIQNSKFNFTGSVKDAQLDISTFEKGMYILKLTTGKDEIYFTKLIKE